MAVKKEFLNLGIPESKIFLNKVSVDTEAFNPKVKPADFSNYNIGDEIPIITYIGKVGVTKGIFEMIEVLSEIREDFRLVFIAGGRQYEKLKESIKIHKLENKTIFLGFLPPWKIPAIIKASRCVVMPEREFEVVGHTPILPREVMSTGVCSIISEELFRKRHTDKIKNGVHTLVVNPKNIKDFREKLTKVIKDKNYTNEIGKNARKIIEKTENFNEYIDRIVKLYKEFE
jgi:glycosyltransferase involved in cell wall biosynthesis